ncbi:MAG: Pr6Pr family membrane protein [Clostridia bacterium]|nr:Pr6Pr family membrane protein [Clostridia bacterium]
MDQKRKIVSAVLKSIVFLCATVGTVISVAAAKGAFMKGSRAFMYFTIQSNIAVAIISLIGLIFLLLKHKPGRAWWIVKFVGTVSITLTGSVFVFVLAPTLWEQAWSPANILTHVAVPIAFVCDFFVAGPYGQYKGGDVYYCILPPLVYAIYASVGYIAGWEFSEGVNYPYFFLNWGSPAGAFGFSHELPFMGCVWWILLLLLVLIGVGALYLRIVSGIRSKRKPGRSD